MRTSEMFDEILELTVLYPRTLLLLLFGQSAHFNKTEKPDRCPPGAFALLTFAGIYLVIQSVPNLTKLFPIPGWISREFALALAFAAVGIIVNIQSTAINKCINGIQDTERFLRTMLVYPYCSMLFVYITIMISKSDSLILMLIPPIIYIWFLYTVLHGAMNLSHKRALASALVAFVSLIIFSAILSLLSFFALYYALT